MSWLLLIIAIAPVVFMFHYVFVRDKYEREPLRRVLFVFFLSFFTVIPAAIFESMVVIPESMGILGIAISVWLVIAFTEETVKLLAVWLLAYRHKQFNEVYDGIIYCVAASLGFATVENLAYVFLSDDGQLTIAILRAVLAVPAHALWGVIMGYYIGKAKFAPADQRRKLIFTGWAWAVFWHGAYDFFAFTAAASEAWLVPAVLSLLSVVAINWIIAAVLISKAQQASVFKRPTLLTNPVQAFNFKAKFCHQCGQGNHPTAKNCTSCGYEFPPRQPSEGSAPSGEG